jgi:hypothetical protein
MPRVSKKEQIKFLKKWSAALRSGKFKQTTSTLGEFDEAFGPSYCCLGVATCVSGDRPISTRDMDGVDFGESKYEFTDLLDVPKGRFPLTCNFLPVNGEELLNKYFGEDPHLPMSSFIKMNDQLGATFDEIADIVDILVMEMQGVN